MPGRTFTVGTGSGNLTIDGATLGSGLLADDVVEIVAGTYNTLTIQDISVPSGKVTIRSQSSRISITQITQSNIVGAIVENIDIRGGTQFNIRFDGNNRPYRNITYRGLTFTGATNFCIAHANPTAYDAGDINTVFDNIKFENNEFVNSRQIRLGGSSTDNTGKLRGLLFKGNTFRNMNGNFDFGDGEGTDGSSVPPNNYIDIQNAENYDFDGNYFYKIYRPDNHTAMIYANGWGIIRNNRAYKYRGQIGRQWIFAFEWGRASYFYNNVGEWSYNYSLAECQTTSGMASNPNFVPSDYYCLFNTAHNIGINEYTGNGGWQAVVLDNYGLQGGNVYFANNVGMQIKPRDITPNNTWWGNTGLVTNQDNRIYPSRVGIVGISLRPYTGSPLIGAGAQLAGYPIALDHLSIARPASIGAFESAGNPPPMPDTEFEHYYATVGQTEPLVIDFNNYLPEYTVTANVFSENGLQIWNGSAPIVLEGPTLSIPYDDNIWIWFNVDGIQSVVKVIQLTITNP